MIHRDENFPRKISLLDIALNSLIVFVSGFLWSIIIVAVFFFLSWNLQFDTLEAGIKKVSVMIPLVFDSVIFIATIITMLLTYSLLVRFWRSIYKSNLTTVFHIIFFSTLIYVFMLPIYIYIGLSHFWDILYIVILHCIISFLFFSLILDVLNNYNYVFLWIYWTFAWTLVTLFFVISRYFYDNSQWKIYLIVMIIPAINLLNFLFKQLFEYLYYQYYMYSGKDPIWHVYYAIEKEAWEK